MRDILELCIRLDTTAEKTYDALAEACDDPDLKLTFERMGMEERVHVEWWTELLAAWNAGLVPAIDDTDLLPRVQESAEQVASTLPSDFSSLSVDDMLDIAAHLEFFMLDPVFGELLDLMEPGSAEHHRDAYSRHVMRLVGEIEARYSRKDLAAFLARVLSRSYRDQQRLATLATHDALTGLYNRRGLYGYLRQWASWASRYNHPLGVLLVDVDRFKAVNDSLGHPGGDDVLRAIASALNNAVRGSDLVGRYGGDEFAILAPETDLPELGGLADRVLELVRTTTVSVGGVQPALTVSVGCSYSRGGSTVTPEQLLAAADLSLYEAKNSGRDRTGRCVDATSDEA